MDDPLYGLDSLASTMKGGVSALHEPINVVHWRGVLQCCYSSWAIGLTIMNPNVCVIYREVYPIVSKLKAIL